MYCTFELESDTEALDARMQDRDREFGHGFEDRAWKRGTTKAGEGRVDGSAARAEV
jgi:hypothetical protein